MIAYEVITSKEDIARYGVIGWDAGRINFVARACCDMKYISEMEAWNYIDKAYELAHSSFTIMARYGDELCYWQGYLGRDQCSQFRNEGNGRRSVV